MIIFFFNFCKGFPPHNLMFRISQISLGQFAYSSGFFMNSSPIFIICLAQPAYIQFVGTFVIFAFLEWHLIFYRRCAGVTKLEGDGQMGKAVFLGWNSVLSLMHFQGPVGFLRPSLIYIWKLDCLVLRLHVFVKRPKAVLADSFSESKAYIFSFRPWSSHFHADPSFWSAPPSNQLLKFKPLLCSAFSHLAFSSIIGTRCYSSLLPCKYGKSQSFW